MRRSTPRRPSRRASLPSHGRYLGCTRVSFPWPPGASAAGLELVTRFLRPGLTAEAAGPPRFLGDPCERALFFDPGGIADARPLRRRDAAFRQLHDVGSREQDFGAQWHGPLTGCLRFAVRVTPAPRKTRFRLLAKLCRAGLVTRGVPSKGFCVTSLPPFPSFPGARSCPACRADRTTAGRRRTTRSHSWGSRWGRGSGPRRGGPASRGHDRGVRS